MVQIKDAGFDKSVALEFYFIGIISSNYQFKKGNPYELPLIWFCMEKQLSLIRQVFSRFAPDISHLGVPTWGDLLQILCCISLGRHIRPEKFLIRYHQIAQHEKRPSAQGW